MSWRDEAACKGRDTDWFYPVRGDEPHPEAVALCAACPVRAACLEAGITGRETGLWGGTSAKQRRLIRESERRRRCVVCGALLVSSFSRRLCESVACGDEMRRRDRERRAAAGLRRRNGWVA